MLGVTVPFVPPSPKVKKDLQRATATLAARSLNSVYMYDHLYLLRVVAMMAEDEELLWWMEVVCWRKEKRSRWLAEKKSFRRFDLADASNSGLKATTFGTAQ